MFKLRFFESVPIAIYEGTDHSRGEQLQARRDLYEYEGGYSWGYKGSGPTSLAYAIAGKFCLYIEDADIPEYAMRILEGIICNLREDQEHDIFEKQIEGLFQPA